MSELPVAMDADDGVRVTVPGIAWDKMKKGRAAAEAERDALKKRLAELERQGVGVTDDAAKRLSDAFAAALVVVGFAVGNLHPLTVRGWPYRSLLELVKLAREGLPGAPVPTEMLSTYTYFAELAEKWEDARSRGEEHALLAEENAARMPTASSLATMGIDTTMPIPEAGERILTSPTAKEVDPAVCEHYVYRTECKVCSPTWPLPGTPDDAGGPG